MPDDSGDDFQLTLPLGLDLLVQPDTNLDGDSVHEMSEEEKRDFRSTRQELSFEQEIAPYTYPEDFDLNIIQDFCDAFRNRERRDDWTNIEVLVDRCLVKKTGKTVAPLNGLALLAAKNPRVAVPGCRLRVLRFQTSSPGVGETFNPIKDKCLEGNIVNIITALPAAMQDVVFDVTWLNPEGKFGGLYT